MIIKPRIRGFVCVTAHPVGCAEHVQEQIDYVKAQSFTEGGPKKVLIIGASTGYGLSSRIVSAFGSKAGTIGVFFERPANNGKTASAGWYNSIAFENEAHADGLYAKSINGDAFSDEIKDQTIDLIKKDMGKVDLIIYSLASPRRTDPKTGDVYKMALKPIGHSLHDKMLDTDKKMVMEDSIESATEKEISDTINIMGGEDWDLWLDALNSAEVLEEGVTTVAYSYIGPEVTWPIYKNGTIGLAKEDLEKTAAKIDAKLKKYGGRAFVSINKGVVTQSSSAIPVVPLYFALLFKVMKEKGIHEGCIEQIQRLFTTKLYNGAGPDLDEAGRIRIDDLEMRPDVQDAVAKLWLRVTTENLDEISDFSGHQQEFLKLFGFGLPGTDYESDVNPEIVFDS